MKKLLLVMLSAFGLAGIARADVLVFHNEVVTIRIDTTKVCGETVMALLGASNAPKDLQWVEAQVVYRGQPFEACAAAATAPDGTPSALVVDEAGDGGYIPLVKFVNENKNI